MRSLTVVLPASMWAMMPKLRVCRISWMTLGSLGVLAVAWSAGGMMVGMVGRGDGPHMEGKQGSGRPLRVNGLRGPKPQRSLPRRPPARDPGRALKAPKPIGKAGREREAVSHHGGPLLRGAVRRPARPARSRRRPRGPARRQPPLRAGTGLRAAAHRGPAPLAGPRPEPDRRRGLLLRQ